MARNATSRSALAHRCNSFSLNAATPTAVSLGVVAQKRSSGDVSEVDACSHGYLVKHSDMSDDGSYDEASTQSGDDSGSISVPSSGERTSSDSESSVTPHRLPRTTSYTLSNTQRKTQQTCHAFALKPVPWASQRRAKFDQSQDEAVVRRARSILNKLTVEKFDSLSEQLAMCGFKTAGQLRQLIHEIFEKATAQHHFVPMYADLCVRLEADPRLLTEGSDQQETSASSFQSLLLDACQTAFEKLLDPGTVESMDDEALLKRKQRALGNVKLVAQLIVRGMLSSRLIIQCAEDLLKAHTKCSEALESLAIFLQVAAPAFDEPSWVHAPQLNSIFWRVLELSSDKSVETRDRFLLRDVLELREAGWCGRRPALQSLCPMKLAQVRLSAEALLPAVSVPKSPAHPVGKTGYPSSRCKERVTCRGQESGTVSPTAASHPPAVVLAEVGHGRKAFCPIAFRRVLADIMKELSQGWNVPAAVRRIREQGMPVRQQAGEFADILTRAAEESRGAARRSAFAFAAGLAAADETSAFDRTACLEGVAMFFQEVYEDLCGEVPRLSSILKTEMLPTLRSVLPEERLQSLTPAELWAY